MITTGKVIFKINDKIIRDNDGNAIIVNITGGLAVLENVPITNEWVKNENTLQAVFTGNDNLEPIYSEKIAFNVSKSKAKLEITAPSTAQVGKTITITVNVTNDDIPVNTGRVTIKLNGKTLKDEKGKAIYAKVENGIARIQYTIPAKTKAKISTLTAVFTDNNYDRCEKEKELTIIK